MGTAGLPERLAMRERDLTSDLESLRQRKAIIETFYAGLTEDQPRAADQLAPARAENLHHLRFCAGVRSRGMRTNCARSSQTASTTSKSLRPPSFSTGSSARSQTKASSNTPVNSRGSGRLPTTATRSTRMGRRMHGVACRPEQDELNRGAPPRRLTTGASFEQDLLVSLCLPPLRNRARRRIEYEAGKLSFFAGGTDSSNPVPSSGACDLWSLWCAGSA